MKYYCKNCGSAFEPGNRVDWSMNHGVDGKECPFCYSDVIMQIPDYETPEQYEKRTGEAYSDNGLVWFREKNKFYISMAFALAKLNKSSKAITVIADPPVPPPDDWRPE